MWYFTWILGLGAALAFGIINVMWLEASYTFGELDEDQAFASVSPNRRGERVDVTVHGRTARLRPPPAAREPQAATLRQVAGAVFWSFFGVRKGRDMLQDTTTINPLHVVIVGAAGGPRCSCWRWSRW